MRFEDRYFEKFDFTDEQILSHLKNSEKDFHIAIKDPILDVKFNYAYSALLKAGITLLSFYHVRIKSVPGHQVKIIQKLAQLANDRTIEHMGNAMRSKRNLDFYGGGVEITEKECRAYLEFVGDVLDKVRKIINVYN